MKIHRMSVLAAAILAGFVSSAAASPEAGAATLAPAITEAPAAPTLSLWNDSTFQREFLGTYGTLAEIEPKLSVVERTQLEKILPLMGSDPKAAEAELLKAAKPESSALFDFTLGNLAFQDGRLDEAASRYTTALAKFPSFRRAQKNLGLVRIQQADFPEALRSLSRVIELGGSDGLTFGLLGYAYSASGQYVSAESAYRNALLLQPGSVDWKVGLTQAVLKQQKFGEAARLAEELIQQDSARTDYWLMHASASVGLGQPMRAAEDYEMLSRMGQATVPVFNTLGDIYVNEGLFDLAVRSYIVALDREWDGAEGAIELKRPMRNVEVLVQRGALPQARELLGHLRGTGGNGLASLTPEETRHLLKLQARLAVAEGVGGEAASALEQVVALDPLDGEALILLGQHSARSGEPDRAMQYYERAESLEHFEAEAKLRHAQVLVSQGRYNDAVPLLRRAQELKPRDEIARYLEQVERVARSRG